MDVSGLLGLAGGAAGTGFSGPQAANVTNPVTQGQITDAYGNVQDAMGSQKALLAALQAQNGLGNQSQVYNQLQGVAAGTGPNPAQAMLNQATGQNVANQAALMAGQRGASSNAGLIARQAAGQGAMTQQQAVGQAAALQAQQSLNAINSAGGIANTQASNQIGQTNANTQAQQAEQAALINAQTAYNNGQIQMQGNINQANAGLANTMMQGQQGLIGGLMNAAGGSAAAGKAQGGLITMADGGDVSAFDPSGPQSKFAQFLNSGVSSGGPSGIADISMNTPNAGADKMKQGLGSLGKGSGSGAPISNAPNALAGGPADAGSAEMIPLVARGGLVPAMLSPGEKYLKPEEAKAVAEGKATPDRVGKLVPGKPKYKGNNYANDVVPAKLKEGGVVIPNSIMQSKDPARGAAEFVRATLAKKGLRK